MRYRQYSIEYPSMKRSLSILFFLFTSSLSAGEFNKKINIGDAAPAWKDLPTTAGKKCSYDDFKSKDYLIVLFTCNSCAYSVVYEDRIIAFYEKYCSKADSKVELVAINVNTVADDRLDKMTERAKEKKFPFIYAYDETQKIARDYGANITPEFFVLDKNRKIVYMGAFDDNSELAKVKTNYLEVAVEAVLNGKEVAKKETNPVGCKIRYAREKK
jgi:peroxiredoxin